MDAIDEASVWIKCIYPVSNFSMQLERMSSEKPKYYINTFTHRVKHRLCQTLILLVRWADEVGVDVGAC